MSTRHPIIAVTGSSGAGTTTVMKSFAHIFRRENIAAQVIEGDSFHRFDRIEMRERVRRADHGEGPQISHFGPESNLLAELDRTFSTYGESGRGELRKYVHDVRNALDRARLRQASRLFVERDRALTREDLITIAEPDIRASRVFARSPRGAA